MSWGKNYAGYPIEQTSWAAQVTGKKDLSLKHPDQIAESEKIWARCHPETPFYAGNQPDHYISPKPLSQMHQSMRKTFDTCFDTSLAKSNDYSKGENTYRNFEGSVRIGVSVQKGIMLRLQDKFIRLENLLESDTPKVAESIEDTIMDAINYLAILKARREYESDLVQKVVL